MFSIISMLLASFVRCFVFSFSAQDELAILSNKRASSAGNSGSVMAAAFERIAKANGGVVSFEQAQAVNAKYPSDLAYYFRQFGGKCITSKARNGNSYWTVQTLSNGKPAYPAAVAERMRELQAEVAKGKASASK